LLLTDLDADADPVPDLIPDPDHALFVSDLQDTNKNNFLSKGFNAYSFLKVHLHNFSKIKRHKEVPKQQKSTFFSKFIFSLIE
jgi:hypothetical protein